MDPKPRAGVGVSVAKAGVFAPSSRRIKRVVACTLGTSFVGGCDVLVAGNGRERYWGTMPLPSGRLFLIIYYFWFIDRRHRRDDNRPTHMSLCGMPAIRQ